MGAWRRVLVAVAVAFVAGQARALPIDVQAFHPSPFMHDMVTVETGETEGPQVWNVGLFVNYQNDPLVLFALDGDEKTELLRIVSHQVTANVLASWRPVEWFGIGLDVPVVLFQKGNGFFGEPAPGVAGMGDVRIYPRFRIVGTEVVQLSATATFSAPTGQLTDDYTGRSTFGFYPGLLLGLRAGIFDLGFDLSWTVSGADSLGDVDLEHSMQAKLGLRVAAVEDLVDLIGEVGGGFQFADPFGSSNESPVEAGGALRFHLGQGVQLTTGASAGVTAGAGAPDVRAYAGIMITSPPEPPPPPAPEPPKDTDGDGLLDPVDQCPLEPEDVDSWQDQDGCPDPDNDGDRILDPWVELAGELEKYAGVGRGSDVCPEVPEDWDGFEDEDGCPDADNDKDDFCDPWVAQLGQEAQWAEICRGVDQCPNEPETVNGLADDDGCPDSRVRLEQDRIVILQVVHFYFDEARIKEESYPLLQDVTDVLLQHPELLKVRIEGHTDERGRAAYNRKLSAKRAAAVRDFLVARGVEAGRLESAGYGADRPVVRKAKTEDEHQQNRRVEFVILERSK